ncbi:adhesion G-protein coupled receptor G6 isoform X5 [Channa argus]|uniref:adhesion G-protein coupled receptor G6 isoform X5 n=1 Tax=Channa argus TaxID=215402 RepID=UPI00351FFAEA
MESHTDVGQAGSRWRLRHVVPVVLLWMTLHQHVLGCSSTNCNLVLTEAQGEITSPCYPQKYPNSQACSWTMQAPAGFIIQLSFLDFDLEEAPGCIYDRVLVNTGSSDVKFCGLTANGLTLNSTGSVMELSFTSDFSVQKRGFNVSFQHVAVALRNQKVRVSDDNGRFTQVSNTVSIPTLSQLTICFEVQGNSAKQEDEWIFTYHDSSNKVLLSLGASGNRMKMIINGQNCALQPDLSSDFLTPQMKLVCLAWSSQTGRVVVYLNGRYSPSTCYPSAGQSVPGGGTFRLGGQRSFDGYIYNLRLWDKVLSEDELKKLNCDAKGNILDWDQSNWTILQPLAQTDTTLSCTCFPNCIHLTAAEPTSGVPMTSSTTTKSECDPSLLGCPVASSPSTPSTDSTNTISATNANSNAPSTIPTTSTNTTSSSSSDQQPASITATASSAPTNIPATNPTEHVYLYYQASFVVVAESSALNSSDIEDAVYYWLKKSFSNSIENIYVNHFRKCSLQSGGDSGSYKCKVLLEKLHTTNKSLDEAAVSKELSNKVGDVAHGLKIQPGSITVRLMVETCPEETSGGYTWPETRFFETRDLPCLYNKDQRAYRNCSSFDLQSLSLSWSVVDVSKCIDISNISHENAEKLVGITNRSLSVDEVSKAVKAVENLVNVPKINSTLASTVINIISNVMTSFKPQQTNDSEIALKSVETLTQKIEFEGPSVNITSKNLILSIRALNTTSFNGMSFSAFRPPNSADVQIDFDSQDNPLAQVTLPASLLSNRSLSEALSRINFMFFNSTTFFLQKQDGRSLNSYVVASSVGNLSIKNLKDPVRIEFAHLSEQFSLNPACVFWDFKMNNESGGWNSEGCNVLSSTSNRTVCLCDHLTHFGILMDVSQSSYSLDSKNNEILTFISYIGCGLSAICTAATLLTYITFEKLRRDYPSKILMNLSASLLFLNMVFLLDGWLASLDINELCQTVAIFLHYFLLTSFTWMGLESVHMYIALVKVFNTYVRRYILKFCIVGWGVPAVVVLIVVSWNPNNYGQQNVTRSDENASKFCFIQNQTVKYITCAGYFCIVFLLNVAMFIVVMMQICRRSGKRSNRKAREEVLRNLRSAISLTFLLGMTWGFALLSWGPFHTTFSYLFTIFNSLQGLFIFIFHCALKENVQKQWRRYLCCSQFKPSDNSDWSKTATNNTKKVSSDNLGKSLSSSSFASSTATWTSKAKVTLNPFSRRHVNTDKPNPTSPKCVSSSCSSSEVEPNSSSSSSSILPVSQMIDKVKGYCSTRTDNFYKNIIMSDGYTLSTRF